MRVVDSAGDEIFQYVPGLGLGGSGEPSCWWRAPNPYDQGVPLPSTSAIRMVTAADGALVTPDHLCPDLLRHANLGEADGMRGRVVRGFFWVLRAWPVGP